MVNSRENIKRLLSYLRIESSYQSQLVQLGMEVNYVKIIGQTTLKNLHNLERIILIDGLVGILRTRLKDYQPYGAISIGLGIEGRERDLVNILKRENKNQIQLDLYGIQVIGIRDGWKDTKTKSLRNIEKKIPIDGLLLK